MHQKKKLFLLLCIPLAAAALFIGYRYSVYRGVSVLPLRTDETDQFEETCRERFELTEISVGYWAFQNLEIRCRGSGWREEDKESLLSDALALLNDPAFQASYARAHDRRYGTDQARPQAAMLYIYGEADSPGVCHQYAAQAPFQAWRLVS